MSKQFATFDEATLPAALDLSFGDQTVQTVGSPGVHQNVRSTFPLSQFAGEVEGIFYSPNASSPSYGESSGAPWIALGILQSTTANSVYVGETADSIGWNPGTGHVYQNNAVLTTIGTAAEGQYCKMLMNPVTGQLTFFADTTLLGVVNITASVDWYYAVSIGGDAGDRAFLVNAGVTPLRAPIIQGDEGWWRNNVAISPLLLATQPYMTQPGDILPSTRYEGDVDRASAPMKLSRGVTVWPWGSSAPPALQKGPSRCAVTILDPHNMYPQLLTSDVRDIRVPIQRLKPSSSLADAENISVGIVDS